MKIPKHIHFVGIKGVGMAPLAILAKEAGIIVSGSDIADGFITDEILAKAGIVPFVGFNPSHIGDADVVITTGAHGGYDNPEVRAAKKQQIPVMTQGEAVGEFMKGDILGRANMRGISILGTHGKTTTSAMIATVLQKAGGDPSWVIGTSTISSLGSSGHFGSGTYFVAEADEYATEPVYDKTTKFLWQHPNIAVITNIEHDHPDLYPTLQDVVAAFKKFVESMPEGSIIIACGDDEHVREVIQFAKARVITYGFSKVNEYVLEKDTASQKKFSLQKDGEKQAYTLSVTGEHTMRNAAAAILVGMQLEIPYEELQTGILAFGGTKRRLEYVGQLHGGALLYDDYAHHPTEIQTTLKTLREMYPTHRIVCIFQPHTFSRTKLLFDQFASSFSLIETVVIAQIYASKREAFDQTISSEMLVEAIARQKKSALLAQTLSDVVKYIDSQRYSKDTVVITMGAGDVYTVAKELLEHEAHNN